MANLALRKDVILAKNAAGVFVPGVGYQVSAFEVGAIAAAISSGAVATVDSGHGFAALDKMLLNPGSSNALGYDAYVLVNSVTSTTITFASSVSIAVGDVLFNLGPDTGSTAPNYDASGFPIYSDMDGGTAIASETVTADANGVFRFWYQGLYWELIRNSAGKPVGVVEGQSGDIIGPGTVVDNAVPRWDGTSGRLFQSSAVIIDDSANVSGINNAVIGGALDHDGATLGFYGTAVVVRPAAYTQGYSTGTRTHAVQTATALTDNGGGAATDNIVQALTDPTDTPVSVDALRDNLVAVLIPELRNNIKELTTKVNQLIVDEANTKQVLNQILDDLQLEGLLQ
jgi:hypothetical protein